MKALLFLQAGLAHIVAAASDASSVLWYSTPAEKDFLGALVVGNGRLGASIHGYTDKELIRLNEESIWSGGPRDRANPAALPSLPKLREQLATGQLTEADDNWIANFTGVPSDMRAYQPAGELRLDFPHPFEATSRYNHSLDISTGLNSLSYVYDNVTYTREVLANFPTNVLALRLFASKPGALAFNVSLSRDQNITALTVNGKTRTLTLSGTGSQEDYYQFVSKARVVLSDGVGHICANRTSLKIVGANEVWIYYDAETNYRYPDGNMEEAVDARLGAAVKSGYKSVRAEAVADYRSLYDRTSVDLGTSGPLGNRDMTTRLANWQKGNNITDDPELLALIFNMGKYLLISSSRPGTLPANLQGVWNRDFVPPWDSKFTLNINLEMNYWLAQPLNMPEISSPVYDMLNGLRATGAKIAKNMYNADGFTCHHNTDINLDCAPYHASSIFSPFPLGGAWLAFEAIEHWRFTGDESFARDTALPILQDTVAFIRSYATELNGHYVISPGCSPENSYIIPEGMSVAGRDTGMDSNAMVDRSIMWEIMTGFIDMSKAVGNSGDNDTIAAAEEFRSRIEGVAVGSEGQMLEWSREFEENDLGHRHFSPLVCAYPGTWVGPLQNSTASDAAYTLLRRRMDNGSGGTSWSIAWAIALHARFYDGDNALQSAILFLARWVHPGLLSRNGGYFQMDGNSGITSGLVEMMLQSHANGIIHLGPALPTTGGMMSGSFSGFAARGGFLVDMRWKDGKVTGAEITSLKGNPLHVRVQNGRSFGVNGDINPAAIKTSAGEMFKVTL